MIFHRLVLCLALLTASVGFAQVSPDAPLAGSSEVVPSGPPPQPESEWAQPPEQSQPEAAPEMTEPPASQGAEQIPAASEPPPPESAAPPGELIPYHYKPENEAPPDLVLPRVLAEAFGGVLGGVGMGIVGLLAGVSALESVDCSNGEDVCAATILIITVPAVFVGIPWGVQMAGQSMGGRGQFLPALGGTLLGTGAGLMYGLTSDGSGDLALGLILGPVIGAIIGYEISNAMVRRGSFAAASSGPRVAPLVGATPRGGIVGGLTGSF